MRKRVLFLTSRFPYPPVSGERVRGYQLVRLLSQEFSVTTVALDPGDPATVAAFQQATGCARVELVRQSRLEQLGGALAALFQGAPLQVGYFRSAAMRAAISRLARDHDAVIFHLIRRSEDWALARGTPRVLEMCDCISENFRQTASHGSPLSPWTWVSALEARRAGAFEAATLAHFDLVSIHTHLDAQRVGIPDSKLLVSTQGVELARYAFVPPAQRTGAGIALVGKMDFYPNRHAAFWFARNVLPLLPEPLHLELIGECPPRLRAQFNSLPRVHATGRVPSVAEASSDCFAAVAPMQVATGVQNKVLEYFAMGLPAVISASVAGGLLPAARGSYVSAGPASEWAAALVDIRQRPGHHDRMARTARAYVEANHDWEAIGREYRAALAGVIDGCARAGRAPAGDGAA